MRRKINVPILKLFLGRLYGTTFFVLAMIWTVLLSLCIIKGIGKKFKTIQEISLCPATAQTPALRLRPNYPPVPVHEYSCLLRTSSDSN